MKLLVVDTQKGCYDERLYSFETPEGKHIMTVELYRGLLVGPDGMYAYTVPQSAVSE